MPGIFPPFRAEIRYRSDLFRHHMRPIRPNICAKSVASRQKQQISAARRAGKGPLRPLAVVRKSTRQAPLRTISSLETAVKSAPGPALPPRRDGRENALRSKTFQCGTKTETCFSPGVFAGVFPASGAFPRPPRRFGRDAAAAPHACRMYRLELKQIQNRKGKLTVGCQTEGSTPAQFPILSCTVPGQAFTFPDSKAP